MQKMNLIEWLVFREKQVLKTNPENKEVLIDLLQNNEEGLLKAYVEQMDNLIMMALAAENTDVSGIQWGDSFNQIYAREAIDALKKEFL